MTKSGFAKEHLKSFIDRIERMETEKAALVADIGEIYKEARGMGFDTKIIRKVVALRKLDTADFQEQMAVLDLYLGAVGMSGLPLGDYAERAPKPPASKPPIAAVKDAASPKAEERALAGRLADVLTEVGCEKTGANTWKAPATASTPDGHDPSVTAMNAPEYKRTIVATVDLAESLPAHMRRTKPPPQLVT